MSKLIVFLMSISAMFVVTSCLLRTDFDPARLAELHWITPPAEEVVISQPIATPDATEIAIEEAVIEATMVTTPAPECLLKGNINSRGEKILHSPGGSSYDRTVIDPERGEQWFCDAASAISEGWREAQ
jgi:hypothetical protein